VACEARGRVDLIDRIYAAALEPELWPEIVEALEAECRDAVALFLPFPRRGAPGVAVAPSIDPQLLASYQRRYFALDPAAAVIADLGVGAVETANGDASRGEPFEREWLAPQGLRRGPISVALIERDPELGEFVLRTFPRSGRGVRARPPGDRWQALLPHLRRAVRVFRRMNDLALERHSLATALDRVATGILVLDGAGRVVVRNRAADRLLAEAGAARPADAGRGSGRAPSERLRRALVEAARSGADAGAPCVTRLPRPGVGRPLEVVTFGCCEECGGTHERASVVFVVDPEGGLEIPAGILRRLFGLTSAEALLACEIAAGRTVEQAAARMGVSHETARSRLKLVFLKTNTHRQSELLRLLLSGAAPILAWAPKADVQRAERLPGT
jgi:DNA-binding CsgD family transcriptional regulator/PAS domain-containing protein